jgi:hypothetical protein
VLLDEAARMSGAVVQLEHWEGAPAFAVRLTPDDRPMLVTQTDARQLVVPAHSLAYVEGGDAQVRLLDLDNDLARDAMVLTGSQGAAQRVASLVDAELTALGDDRFQLKAADVLDRSAFLDAPRGLREVRPIELTPEAMRPLLGQDSRGGPALAWSQPDRPESVSITMVGVYTGPTTTLILDAEGGYTLLQECGEPLQGTVVRDGERLVLLDEDSSPRALHPLEAGGFQLGSEQLQLVQLNLDQQEVNP